MKHEYWGRFRAHQRNARQRGIEFLLTFEEWPKIWTDSNHLHERGARKGCYNMARFGDKGPYVIGNVRIILHEENTREKIVTDEQRLNLSLKLLGNKNCVGNSNALGRRDTPEQSAQKSARLMGNKYAVGNKNAVGPRTEEQCTNIKLGIRAGFARRKERLTKEAAKTPPFGRKI